MLASQGFQTDWVETWKCGVKGKSAGQHQAYKAEELQLRQKTLKILDSEMVSPLLCMLLAWACLFQLIFRLPAYHSFLNSMYVCRLEP